MDLRCLLCSFWAAACALPAGGGGGGGFGTGIWACRHEAARAEVIRNRKNLRSEVLMARRVVSVLGIDGERRKSLWRAELDFNFSPLPIVGVIAWAVSNDILIAQLHADFGGNVRQVLQAADRESAAAGQQRHFRQQAGAFFFFLGRAAARFIQTDGVNLDIRFPGILADIFFGVAT